MLAPRLLGIYRTLKNKWVFEDLTNYVLARGGEGGGRIARCRAESAQ